MKAILAVDLGTSGVKVGLVATSGEILSWENEPIQLILTGEDGAEQSPEEWWQAFLKAAKRLLKRNLISPQEVHAICCSTQGEGTIPVDEEGKALYNCILWMDMRGAPFLKKQFRGLINLNGVSLFHTLRWIRLTGGMPSLTGKDPQGHMLFLKEALPEIYSRTYKFLNVLDYMNLLLTGKFLATYDSILTSWVTDNRNPNNICYAPSLVKRCGIDEHKLPEIVAPTEVIGELKEEVALELGIGKDVKVVAGSIDTTAAAIGSGAVEDYMPHLYLGTSSWIAAHVPFKKTDIVHSLASVPCAIPGRYLLTALQATAGGNLVFLKDNILYHKDELLGEAQVPDIYKLMDDIAERVPPGANGLLYTPWIWGERAPVEDRTLRAGLYNISLGNTREDIIRAFFEGIALNTRWLLNPVENFLKRKIKSINIVGGGAQSDIWCQIFADVLNVEIRQVEEPLLANLRGAAWIAAVGIKELHFEEIPALIKFKKIYRPNPKNCTLYNEKFGQFQEVYHRLRGFYHNLNG